MSNQPSDAEIEIERRQHVAAVVAECQTAIPPVPLNHSIVAAILESRLPGFAYDPAPHLDDFHRHLDTMDTAPAKVSAESADTAQAEVGLQSDSEPVVEQPIDVPALRARREFLEQHAATLRSAIYQLTAARQIARADLATAISGWSASVPVLTPEQNVRAYLAASALEREQAKKNGASRVPAGGFGRSVIDRSAAYGHGGNAEDFVRKQLRTGFRRGAKPQGR